MRLLLLLTTTLLREWRRRASCPCSKGRDGVLPAAATAAPLIFRRRRIRRSRQHDPSQPTGLADETETAVAATAGAGEAEPQQRPPLPFDLPCALLVVIGWMGGLDWMVEWVRASFERQLEFLRR